MLLLGVPHSTGCCEEDGNSFRQEGKSPDDWYHRSVREIDRPPLPVSTQMKSLRMGLTHEYIVLQLQECRQFLAFGPTEDKNPRSLLSSLLRSLWHLPLASKLNHPSMRSLESRPTANDTWHGGPGMPMEHWPQTSGPLGFRMEHLCVWSCMLL